MTSTEPRRGRRLVRVLLGGVALLGLALALTWWLTLPRAPDAFYDVDAEAGPLPAPGTLLRVEAFTRAVPEGADGWRLLYTTTDPSGRVVPGSAIVLASTARGDAALPVVVWTHGTTGVARACAPSVLENPFANVPALPEALAAGWAVVAPDYAGLGTDGLHGYLVGESQARSTWDALRAARQMDDLTLGTDVVLWGHSQGGHAALWSAALAPRDADAGRLRGVAAMAPASDLVALVREAQDTPVGKMLSSYIVTAYAAHYPELDAATLVRPVARPVVRDIARRCMAGLEALPGVVDALVRPRTIFRDDPTQGALGARLLENRAPITRDAPVLLLQGDADPLVLPSVQAAFVRDECARGGLIDYRTFAGEDHLSLVAPDSPAEAALLDWTRARFAGEAASERCPGG